MTHNRILVTGANGFVGRNLCFVLGQMGYAVRGAIRQAVRADESPLSEADLVDIGNIDLETDWARALDGIDTVVHLAARVHILKEDTYDAQAAFHQVNAAGTERLARMAAQAGVPRLVHMSSIMVSGKSTPERPFTEEDAPCPHDPYAVTKCEAEKILWRISEETGLEVVVLRSPLVYGPGVKANFLRLMKCVDRGIPLPFSRVHNRRSLIYVGNLADAIATCIAHPRAAGKTFLVSDGEDVSTPELIRRLAQALSRPVRLIPFPPALLHLAGYLTGKTAETDRLLGSLMIDSSKIRQELDWNPPYTMAQGLQETAEWYNRFGVK